MVGPASFNVPPGACSTGALKTGSKTHLVEQMFLFYLVQVKCFCILSLKTAISKTGKGKKKDFFRPLQTKHQNKSSYFTLRETIGGNIQGDDRKKELGVTIPLSNDSNYVLWSLIGFIVILFILNYPVQSDSLT